MSDTLATQYVEFVSKGLSSIQDAMRAIKDGLGFIGPLIQGAQGSWDRLGEATQRTLTGMRDQLAIFRGLAVAMGLASAGAIAWAKAGLSGTAQGNLMSLQFQLIAREITSVFLPTINAINAKLQELLGWFRQLSGDQQRFIQRFVEAAAVMAVVLGVLPKVAGMLAGLIPVIKAVGLAVTGSFTEAAVAVGVASGGIVPLIGLIITAMVGLGIGTEAGRSGISSLAEAFRPLMAVLGDIGSVIAEKLSPLLEQLGGIFAGALSDALESCMSLFASLAPVVVQLVEAFINLLQPLLPVISFIMKLGAVITQLQFGLIALVANILTPILDVGNAIFKAFRPMIILGGQILQALIPIGKVLFDLIILPFRLIGQLLAAVFGVPDFGSFTDALKQIAEWLGIIVKAIAEWIAGAINTVVGVVAGAIEKLASLISMIPALGERVAREMRRVAADIRQININMDDSNSGPRGRPRQQATNAGGGPESADALFRRLQTASLKTETDPNERTARAAERIDRYLRESLPAWARPTTTPAVTV